MKYFCFACCCGAVLTKLLIFLLFCSIGELQKFYRLTPIAVIGGSFLPGSAGHNISEAAAAGCAILTGQFISCLLDRTWIQSAASLGSRLLSFVSFECLVNLK